MAVPPSGKKRSVRPSKPGGQTLREQRLTAVRFQVLPVIALQVEGGVDDNCH